MTLKIDAKFEGKLAHASKNDMKNLAIFTTAHLKVYKLELLLCPFIQSRKCMSLRFTGELCVMTMKDDSKFEEDLTCHFETDMRNLTNLDLSTQKSQKFVL